MYWPIFSLIIMASWSVHEFFRYWPSYPYFSQLIGWFPPPSTTPSLFPAVDPAPSFSSGSSFSLVGYFYFIVYENSIISSASKKNNIIFACTFLLACRVVSFRVLTFRSTLYCYPFHRSFPPLLLLTKYLVTYLWTLTWYQ